MMTLAYRSSCVLFIILYQMLWKQHVIDREYRHNQLRYTPNSYAFM
jgi:hypothetical protein